MTGSNEMQRRMFNNWEYGDSITFKWFEKKKGGI